MPTADASARQRPRRSPLPSSVLWIAATLGSAIVAASALAGPVASAVLADLVQVGSVALVALGIRRNLGHEPPETRRTFWLLALWLLGLASGDIVWDLLDLTGAALSFDVTLADPIYLLSYVFVAWAVVRLVRARSVGNAKEALIDGVIFATAALIVIWVFLVPGARAGTHHWFEVAVLGAYPLMDVLLVAGLAWLLLTPGPRPVSLFLLLAHLVMTLATDVVWMAMNRYAPGADSTIVNLGWPLANLALALAVIHPSVSEIGKPPDAVSPQSRDLPIVRLALIGMALFVPATVIVVAGHRALSDTIVLLVSAAVLVTLVLWRVANVLREKEQAQVELRSMYVELERSQDRLNHQATHDALTGLMNRAELMRTMNHLLRNRPETASAAVLFVDLDSFKEVNDAEGHAVGDALLVVLAARLQGAVRPGDIVARFGGDEFVVVLPRATEDEAIVVAERIIERCCQPVVARDVRIRVGASVGVTVLHGASDAEAVLRSADAAMYEAKRSGRSCYALRRLAV